MPIEEPRIKKKNIFFMAILSTSLFSAHAKQHFQATPKEPRKTCDTLKKVATTANKRANPSKKCLVIRPKQIPTSRSSDGPSAFRGPTNSQDPTEALGQKSPQRLIPENKKRSLDSI
jgi:hypothetical protein